MLRMLPVSYHQPLPAHVHEFLAHYSPGTFYDKAIQEFGARVGLDASDLALRQFLVACLNQSRNYDAESAAHARLPVAAQRRNLT